MIMKCECWFLRNIPPHLWLVVSKDYFGDGENGKLDVNNNNSRHLEMEITRVLHMHL